MNNDRSAIGFDGMKGTTAKDESREISKLDYDLFINLAHTRGLTVATKRPRSASSMDTLQNLPVRVLGQ